MVLSRLRAIVLDALPQPVNAKAVKIKTKEVSSFFIIFSFCGSVCKEIKNIYIE